MNNWRYLNIGSVGNYSGEVKRHCSGNAIEEQIQTFALQLLFQNIEIEIQAQTKKKLLCFRVSDGIGALTIF